MTASKTIYLCGAINGCSDAECKDWREHVKSIWPGSCLDPMRRDYRGREDECVGEIIAGDVEDLRACDGVLVSADRPSWGTAMEIRIAYAQLGKPVVIVCPEDMRVSPWLRGHSHAVVHTYGAGVAELARIMADRRVQP